MSLDLEQLLREADSGARPPADRVGDMGQRVRSMARRRRRSTRVAGVAVVLIVAVSLLWNVRPEPATSIVREDAAAAPSLDEIEDALASLDAEADARTAIVERLVITERRRDAVRPHVRDPLVAVLREQDKAAQMIVREADRLAHVMNERARAEQAYRRVLALFPDTHWASVARERLVELNGASRRPESGVVPVRTTIEELS